MEGRLCHSGKSQKELHQSRGIMMERGEGAEPLGGRISMIGGLEEEAVPKMTAMLGGLREPGQ